MWQDMFVEQIPVAEKLLRTVLVYVLIALLIRITGKRSLAGLTTLDFIVFFLLSNVVQNAIIGNDNSLLGGMIGAVILVAVNAAVNRLIVVSSVAERIFEGRPTVVIEDGHAIKPALRRLGIKRSELEHAVRMQNGDDVSEIANGILEPGGHLVLTLKPEEQGTTKEDLAEIAERLARIENLLAAQVGRT